MPVERLTMRKIREDFHGCLKTKPSCPLTICQEFMAGGGIHPKTYRRDGAPIRAIVQECHFQEDFFCVDPEGLPGRIEPRLCAGCSQGLRRFNRQNQLAGG
jgi:hypothetical protein